ncbi:unnamed protein product [Camellia sinensis]
MRRRLRWLCKLLSPVTVTVSKIRGSSLSSPAAISRRKSKSVGTHQFSKTNMAGTACFMIVSRNDIPIYEAEVGSALKKEDAAQQHQFILHAALDIVQDLAWTTSAMFLKAIDRFNDLVVSVYVTAGHYPFGALLIKGGKRSRNDDGIKSFFQEVHELYIKILLNPLYLPGSRITSSHFDTKVRALARKYL